ncbi:uncharacterized protein DSM5745_09889 [Aspergillus mulundensis]|uniref:C2H2-type domain-containing protein n=1 Tax=Aspergillus mulundensis TaxID=1810919 RepID=A0A3D8QS27_9EURO|nr:hypothetical protein DSM5745_09889 [Aspergillus mulundensis]RDW64478.1 hypothetical protein DSM5745_09889 [Aspergillus mulundensis]
MSEYSFEFPDATYGSLEEFLKENCEPAVPTSPPAPVSPTFVHPLDVFCSEYDEDRGLTGPVRNIFAQEDTHYPPILTSDTAEPDTNALEDQVVNDMEEEPTLAVHSADDMDPLPSPPAMPVNPDDQNANQSSLGIIPVPPYNPNNPGQFQCPLPGCTRRGGFNCKGWLMRHIRAKHKDHASPDNQELIRPLFSSDSEDTAPLFPCPWPRCPHPGFDQEAWLKRHIKAVHEPNPSLYSLDGEDGPPRFQCTWPDCTQRGGFNRKAALMRHVETKHISPSSFLCLTCWQPFDRADNLQEHIRRMHLENEG